MSDTKILKIFHFARFDLGMIFNTLGVMPAAGLLHADRLAPRPHLHRQAWAQGPRPRAARRRHVEAAAVVRLGRRDADRRPARLCGVRRAPSPRAEGQARRHAGPGGPRASWPRPASASCPIGPGSTSPAGRPRTFSPIRDGLAATGPYSQRIFNPLNRDMNVAAEANLGDSRRFLGSDTARKTACPPPPRSREREATASPSANGAMNGARSSAPRGTAGGCGCCGWRSR